MALALLTGRGYGAFDARALGFVDEIAGEDKALTYAIDMLGELGGKDPGSVGRIKEQLYRSAMAELAAGG